MGHSQDPTIEDTSSPSIKIWLAPYFKIRVLIPKTPQSRTLAKIIGEKIRKRKNTAITEVATGFPVSNHFDRFLVLKGRCMYLQVSWRPHTGSTGFSTKKYLDSTVQTV
jgi:hypothetical protein